MTIEKSRPAGNLLAPFVALGLLLLPGLMFAQPGHGPIQGSGSFVPLTGAGPVTVALDDSFFVNVAGGTPPELAVNNGTVEIFTSVATYIDAAAGTDELVVQDGVVVVAAKLVMDPMLSTCTDSGNGSAATKTLGPTSGVVHVTNSDADGCTLTMNESGAISGQVVRIVVVSNAGGAVNFADTAGVTEIAGAFAAALWDSITLEYTGTTWVELARSNN